MMFMVDIYCVYKFISDKRECVNLSVRYLPPFCPIIVYYCDLTFVLASISH